MLREFLLLQQQRTPIGNWRDPRHADLHRLGAPSGTGMNRHRHSNHQHASWKSHDLPPIDAEIYKWRHLIENFFCKLKEFKRIAMRADKTDQSFAANIHLAAAVINSR